MIANVRSRIVLLLPIILIGVFALPHLSHAAILYDLSNPIIPNAYNKCAAGWGMVLLVINNIISFGITVVILIVAPIMLAYAGFLFVTNPINSKGKDKAKSTLLNLIAGIVIALTSWLIVDAVMTTLYHPSDSSWGTWSSLVTSGGASPCLTQAGSTVDATLNQSNGYAGSVNSTATGIGSNGGQYLTLPTAGNCSPSSLLQATAGSPYPLTQAQANTLSCIAVPESTCGTNTTGAKTPGGTPTTASGMFQIMLAFNDTCHNLNIPSCTAAAQQAGYKVSGNLNCSTAFTATGPKAGYEALAAACLAASANLNCNVQAASCLVHQDGGFSAWTADSRSATQQNCISQYANK